MCAMPRSTLAALLLLAACSSSGSGEPSGKDEAASKPPPAPVAAQSGRVTISVTEKGFEPTPIQVAFWQPLPNGQVPVMR